MRRFRERVVAAIREHALWKEGERVCVAVSGGRDSMVLLDALVATRGLHKGVLSVRTVDHGTRPGSADDAAFVGEACERYRLPFHRVALSLGPDASEAVCRDARQRALNAAQSDVIAVAHHARDQAETLLIRLLRGTGPRGIGGMVPRRGRWARPMLHIGYDEVLSYASAADVRWVDDPSNASDRFLRNRVRRELLPLLESLRPGSVRSVARTAQMAAEESVWLDALSAAWPGADEWTCAFLSLAPIAVVRRVVLMDEHGLEHKHVRGLRHLASEGRGTLQLPGGRMAIAEDGRVRICTGTPSLTQSHTGGACDT